MLLCYADILYHLLLVLAVHVRSVGVGLSMPYPGVSVLAVTSDDPTYGIWPVAYGRRVPRSRARGWRARSRRASRLRPPEEVRVSQAIITAARQTIVVADKSKFTRKAPVKISSLSEVDHVVTDGLPSERLANACADWGTKVHLV